MRWGPLPKSLAAVLVLVTGLAGCAPKGDALYARAEQSMTMGEVQAAVIDLKSLLQDQPQHAKARALLGRALLAGGDISAAAVELQKAKDLGAARSLTLVPSCQVLAATGELEKVLAECRPDAVGAEYEVDLHLTMGRALLGLKRDREARDRFQAALSTKPDDLDALLGLADATATVEGLVAARRILDTAPAAVREQPQYWMFVGGMSVEGDDLPRAEQAYARADELARMGRNPSRRRAALSALADAQLRQGKVKEAIAATDELTKLAPEDPLVKQLRGQVAVMDGRLGDARTLLEQVVAASPENQEARMLLGLVNLQLGNLGQAEMHFSSVVTHQPDNARAQRLLSETRVRLKGHQATAPLPNPAVPQGAADPLSLATNEPSSLGDPAQVSMLPANAQPPDVDLVVASGHLLAGDLGKARAAIDEAAKLAPDSGHVSNTRGLVLLAAKDLPGALTSFQRATTQAPKAHGYALNLARAHLLNRDVDAALGVLDGLLAGEPKLVPALALAGASSLQAGQTEKATGYVERLRQAAPEASITHWLEGDLAMNQKRYREALEHYRRASANGTNAALVMAQYSAGSRAGSARPHRVLEDWLAANPNDLAVMTVLADDRQRRGDVEGAIQLYEAALVSLPDNVVVFNNLAFLYQGQGDLRAVEMAAKAHSLAPASPAVQDTYGWLLAEGGNLDEGLEMLRDAVRRLPDNAEVQYHYAATQAKKGNDAEALGALEKALRGQLPPEAKADAQRLQQQLSP